VPTVCGAPLAPRDSVKGNPRECGLVRIASSVSPARRVSRRAGLMLRLPKLYFVAFGIENPCEAAVRVLIVLLQNRDVFCVQPRD
jgi:hypothetical protein